MKSPSQNKLRLSRRISYHACETIHSPLIKGMTGDWETLQAFPAWGRGTASAALGCFRMQHKCASLSPILPAVFHAIVTLSAPAGHLPLEGKAAIRGYHLLNRRRYRPCESIRSPSTVIPSAAEGSLLHCRHMHTCALTQTTPWCFLFRLSLTHGLPVCKKDPSTSVGMTGGRRIASHSFSHRCVDPSYAFGAPLLQGATRIVI